MVQACISNILATKTKTATKTANTKTKKPDAGEFSLHLLFCGLTIFLCV
jgi:preprotein translocase subunit Sss1